MDKPTERKSQLAPVIDAETRLLILGSLPGDVSLRAGQYYAHPRNGFWVLMGGVIVRDLATLDYDHRLSELKRTGVGLWDVIASADRRGSLDAAIRAPEEADLPGLIKTLPRLTAVAFNGATAARLGRRILGDPHGLALISLPSSSPAHTRPMAEKVAAWNTLRRSVAAR